MKKMLLLNSAPIIKIGISLCSTFLILNAAFSQSPDWLWAKSMGETNIDHAQSIKVDAAGNVYTTGRFWGTVDFDPGAGVFNLTSLGTQNVFISKLDSSGNFVWAKAMGGLGGNGGSSGLSIALDAFENIYTTGNFSGTGDFDPGAGIFNLTSVGNNGNIFISKLDNSGNFVWAKAIVGLGINQCYSIAIDSAGSGDVYTTGNFTGTTDFDPGAAVFNLVASGGTGIFISKLDSSGNFAWAKAMDGNAYPNISNSIALDLAGSGDIYTTGYFNGTVDFDPGAGVFNLTSVGTEDIFISKLDSSGNFVWANRIGGTSQDYGVSLALDPAGSGNVYITGAFSGTVDFDPGASVFNLSSSGNDDIFISKLDSSGNFVWAKKMGGAYMDWGYSIALDPAGSEGVYTTGWFQATVDFDPGAGVFNLTAAPAAVNIFISKLDSSGNFKWAKAIAGTNDDRGWTLTTSASGNVHVAGYFGSASLSFGATTLTNNGGPWGLVDLFIAKLDTAIIMTGNNDVLTSLNMTSVFPNPATDHLTIALEGRNTNVEVTITDITGKIIYTTTAVETQKLEVNTKYFMQGVYVVRVQGADFVETKKLIVTK